MRRDSMWRRLWRHEEEVAARKEAAKAKAAWERCKQEAAWERHEQEVAKA